MSFFANHSQNVPVGSLSLVDLYNQLVKPDRDPFIETVNMIQRLRGASPETQKQIKGSLPAFCPGAIVDTKRSGATSEQKNIRPSGFMQIDIDLHDNANMTNASEVRDKLSQIPYIALSAISARGQGVWGLIALQEPDKFVQYADQVHDYFSRARITIDKSKSKNLTELRYFAPDPGAVLNINYKLMPLITVKPKVKPMTAYASNKPTGTSLSELMQWVVDTTGFNFVEGQIHNYILWLSYAIRKNGASESEVYNMIYSIISPDEIKTNCITSGLRMANDKGIYVPIERPIKPQIKPKQYRAKIPTATTKHIIQYVPITPALIVRHDCIGTDGKLMIHYPGLPELN